MAHDDRPGPAVQGDGGPPPDEKAGGDIALATSVPAGKRLTEGIGLWDKYVKCERNEPLPSYVGLIEEPGEGRVGICCSGGGIRSAAFNLGALQELQRANVLQGAKYLAAVSGGSYIAAAFSMVAKTWDPDKGETDDSDPNLVTEDKPPFYRGSPEEQYLRNRTSYMAPGGVGKLQLFLRVVLGFLVNLLLIASVMTLVGGALALYYAVFHDGLFDDPAAMTGWWGLVAAPGFVALLLGLWAMVVPKNDGLRHALEVWCLRLVGVTAGLALVEFAIPELVEALRNADTVKDEQNAVGGVVTLSGASMLAAVLVEVRARVRDVKSTAAAATRFGKAASKLGVKTRTALAYFVAAVIGPLLTLALVVGAVLLFASEPHFWARALVPAGAAAVFVVINWGVADLTKWSIHPFYRRRLATAFALKRVRDDDGVDPRGKAVERTQDSMAKLSESGVRPGPGWPRKEWPTLVVCAAANVSDPGATPPGRSVTSFTFSPAAVGGPLIGGIETREFENRLCKSALRDFNVLSAVAISGAAVSPSMGKMTRRPLTFLLALANVRLGVWVPNPRRIEKWRHSRYHLRTLTHVWNEPDAKLFHHLKGKEHPEVAAKRESGKKSHFIPRPRPRYLLKELLGWNSVNDRFLYVTDGGHYENLGLVELMRRGCTRIYCFDASGGRNNSALGDAIALARSELKAEIYIDPSPLDPDPKTDLAKAACVTGVIKYHTGETGTLTYARTLVTKDAPYDVHAFREQDADFPHHSTADQLYTDQKFEAYRVLGEHAAQSALNDRVPPALLQRLRRRAGRFDGRSPAEQQVPV